MRLVLARLKEAAEKVVALAKGGPQALKRGRNLNAWRHEWNSCLSRWILRCRKASRPRTLR